MLGAQRTRKATHKTRSESPTAHTARSASSEPCVTAPALEVKVCLVVWRNGSDAAAARPYFAWNAPAASTHLNTGMCTPNELVISMLRPSSKLFFVFLLACATSCGGDDPPAPTTSTQPHAKPEEQSSAISPTCEPPPDCLPIVSLINLDVCCSETLRCGLDVSPLTLLAPMYPDLASRFEIDPAKPCWPRDRLFFEVPTPEATRIEVDDGADVLLAPSCAGRLVTTTQMLGCCRPDNTCGYDTSLVVNTFNALSKGASADALSKPECLSASELNARLRDNQLEAFAYVPSSAGECDYATLDASL